MKEFAPLTCRRCWYSTISGYSYERGVRAILVKNGWRVEKRLRTSICPRCLFGEAFRDNRVHALDDRHFVCNGLTFKYCYIEGEGNVLDRIEKQARGIWVFMEYQEALDFSKKFKTE